MDYSMPGYPVLHHLLECTQIYVHWVGDAIQPSHPLSSPSPPAFNLSQHQGLFQWVSSSHQVAKVLELQLQHQSFQWIFRVDFLYNWLARSPCSPRDSQESLTTTVGKHQFFMVQLSCSYMTTGKTIVVTRWAFVASLFSRSLCLHRQYSSRVNTQPEWAASDTDHLWVFLWVFLLSKTIILT